MPTRAKTEATSHLVLVPAANGTSTTIETVPSSTSTPERSEIHWRSRSIQFEIRRHADPKSVIVDVIGGQLTVTSPTWVRVADLEVIVRQHVHWVLPRIKKAQDPPAPPTERKFLDGEEVRYLGKRLGLRVIDAEKPDHARIIGREYRVTIRTGLGGDERREAVRRVLTDSMREHARLYLPERVRYVADRLDQPVPDVIVCEQDGWVRWDERGAMNVDWRLVQANVYGIQALFARELGTRAGHGPDDEMFWLRVRMMWPDFDERLEQLRVMGEGFVW